MDADAVETAHVYRARPDGRSMLYAWFGAMHTRVDVAIVGSASRDDMLNTVSLMRRHIAHIEHVGNRFDPTSELAAVNRTAATTPVRLSATLRDIVSRCLRYHDMTGGLFDITAGSDAEGATTARDIALDDVGMLMFRRSGVRIDLSGFLKGYALETMRPVLDATATTDVLINMGNSSVMARGNMDTDGWQVAFGADAATRLTLRDCCLTTSGNDTVARRHIIDPRTGSCVEGCRSVAIANGDAAEGEVLSTTLFIDAHADCNRFRPFDTIAIGK